MAALRNALLPWGDSIAVSSLSAALPLVDPAAPWPVVLSPSFSGSLPFLCPLCPALPGTAPGTETPSKGLDPGNPFPPWMKLSAVPR